MNKSHKVGRVHGWILYCGLIMPLLVAFLVDFVILVGGDLGEYDLWPS